MNWKALVFKISRSQLARRVYTALSGIPVLGWLLRRLGRGIVPVGTHIWLRISGGLGKGLWAHLDPRFEMVYASAKYEPPIQQALSKHLEPGSVFYDVGAHIGIVSLYAARLVGTKGAVFAFEADPDNAERIKEHVRQNMFDQIQVVPCAVWSSAGHLRFERASGQSSRNQGAVTTGPPVGSENTIEVEAIALNDFAQTHPPPTLIKIDVEGAEADVLRGSETIFARSKPVLICEVHHRQAAEGVTQWLKERGYTFEWVESSSQFPRHLLARSGI
jgi:FkbM family methyltransferase